MAVLSANGLGVAKAMIHLPEFGRGWVDLTIDEAVGFAKSDAVLLEFETGETITCTCSDEWLEQGFSSATLRLGANGFGKRIPQKFYEGIPAATVIGDLLREIGEVPGQINAPQILTQWVREAGAAGHALTALCRAINVPWRVGLDGRTNVTRAAPTKTLTLEARRFLQSEVILDLAPQVTPFSHNLAVSADGETVTGVPRAVRHVLWGKDQFTEVRL